jgi:hypothetical protein
MEVKPQYSPVGQFFKYQPVYRVPAYQRSYSWEQLEIEDFIRDLETCYDKRKYDSNIVHFFGQIVCIEDRIQGTFDLPSFQLVDGQQRIVTFTLLVLALLNIYRTIITENDGEQDFINQKGVLASRIKDLTSRYIIFNKEIAEELLDINVLELSNRDRVFYRAFIQDIDTEPERESHKLIKLAYDMIRAKVDEITMSGNIKDRLGNLKMVEQILENDFCILNMITNDRKAAFKLFQVLNNRGKNLTEGDLLRAESLRILEPHQANQLIVEDAWDNILEDTPQLTERFLRAIYGSYKGQKASTNSLFNEFLTAFIPQYEYENIEATNAQDVQDNIKGLEKDIITLRKLNNGQWPYDPRNPVEHWDRNRLTFIVQAFDHIECLPYLLSANLLDHKLFNDIVQTLERFIFRYLIVGNQYIGDLITIYNEEAKIIRDNPTGYTLANLNQKLQPLEDRVNDEMFSRLLEDFKYQKTGGKSNKPVKYFLLTIEYYYRWFKEGAAGVPTCLDKERVYDFVDSTIEHIYPHNAGGGTINADLEPLKNSIGNLTILGNADNRTGDNDNFAVKKPVYESSSLMMNRDDISVIADWTKVVVDARNLRLKEMACRIFKL